MLAAEALSYKLWLEGGGGGGGLPGAEVEWFVGGRLSVEWETGMG